MKKKEEEVEYRDYIKNDRRVYGIPFHVDDESWGDDSVSLSAKDVFKLIWLLERYMVEQDINLFDFINDWTEEVEKKYREYQGYFEEIG